MSIEFEAPHDAAKVRDAFRFGWTIAEIRGRYRLGRRHVALPDGPNRARVGHALPLARERLEADQKREVHRVLVELARTLKLDPPLTKLGIESKSGGPKQCAADCAAQYAQELEHELRMRVKDREESRPNKGSPGGKQPEEADIERDPTRTEGWRKLAELLYHWDASNQDTLATRPSEAAAYQLGRGLAEPYWALEDDAESWTFLLGAERRTFLKRQLSRLSAYVAPLVPVAINQSLDDWCEVAGDAKWRTQPGARADLHRQVLIWRDLVQGEREPSDLFAERKVRVPMRILSGLLKSFGLPLLFGVVGLCALVAGGLLFADPEAIAMLFGLEAQSSPAVSVFIAVLGLLGITAAGAYARAKALALSLIDQLRNLYLIGLVSSAATIRPKAPVLSQPGTRARDELSSRLASGINSQVTRESL
jgi:hypothetical protein